MVWRKTQEELEIGFLRGLFTKAQMDEQFGEGQWRPLVRFATWQEGSKSWRVIDNGRSAAHNDTVATCERIHTTSTEVGLAMAQRFRRYAAAPLSGGLELRSSTSDMWKAFRQIPVCDEHLPFHIVAVFCQKTGSMLYAPLDGMAFGLAAAVHQFNRVPAFLLAVARRFLAIPVVGFYDDYRITDLEMARGSADATFQALLSWLHIRLDAKKHQPPSSMITFIGAVEDSSRAGYEEEVFLKPKPGRVSNILGEIDGVLKTGACKPDLSHSLFGKLLHLGTTYPAKIGRGQLTELSKHAYQADLPISPEMHACLRFHVALASMNLVRRIPLKPADLHRVIVFSDASWGDGDTWRGGRICWWVVCESRGIWRGAVTDLLPENLTGFRDRKTQIMAAELFGPVLALLMDWKGLEHTSAVFWIDNMSALCALVTGSCKAPDLAGLASGMHLGLAKRSVWAWFEFVDSAANPADGGSREGVDDDLARQLGVPLRLVSFPLLPQGFPKPLPAAWLDWWDGPSSV